MKTLDFQKKNGHQDFQPNSPRNTADSVSVCWCLGRPSVTFTHLLTRVLLRRLLRVIFSDSSDESSSPLAATPSSPTSEDSSVDSDDGVPFDCNLSVTITATRKYLQTVWCKYANIKSEHLVQAHMSIMEKLDKLHIFGNIPLICLTFFSQQGQGRMGPVNFWTSNTIISDKMSTAKILSMGLIMWLWDFHDAKLMFGFLEVSKGARVLLYDAKLSMQMDIHRVHKKVSQMFCYNFKNCSQISINFSLQLQQSMLNNVHYNYPLHLM